MYLEFFGLHEFPFSLTPNTQFFMALGHYRAALETLKVAIDTGEGFLKITGEVGTGKTLLCRKLLGELEGKHHTLYIPNPSVTPLALLQNIAEEMGLDTDESLSANHVVKAISNRLISLKKEQHRSTVLCIDEAQTMSMETLESMRMLTNLETEQSKLLQVVLFGQPELDSHLHHNSLRQLLQRITFSYNLQPLAYNELQNYVQHRLRKAGSDGKIRFEQKALKALYKGSRGYPRLINILAHKGLMLGYGQGVFTITSKHIRAAITDTEGAIKPKLFGLFSL